MNARRATPLPGDTLALKPDDLAEVFVRLTVEGTQYLLLTLGSDGNIQRGGRGERDILRGTTTPDLFERVRRNVTPELLHWGGQSWADPYPRGKSCELVVGFKEANGREILTRWEYGSESPEPPLVVRDFVLAAVEATNPWYQERRELRLQSRRRREPDGWRLVPLCRS